jgi:hypothetical protein
MMLYNRFGINKKETEKIINETRSYGLHDCVTIDRTECSPLMYRKNHYTPLKIMY